MAQPDAVLDDDRFVETHLLPDFRHRLGCRLQSQHGQGRIAWHQPQDDEDDDRKEQQHRDRLQQAAQNVPVHHLTPMRSRNREEQEETHSVIISGWLLRHNGGVMQNEVKHLGFGDSACGVEAA